MHRLITDLTVFDFTPYGMVLIETQDGVSVEEVIKKQRPRLQSVWSYQSNRDFLEGLVTWLCMFKIYPL